MFFVQHYGSKCVKCVQFVRKKLFLIQTTFGEQVSFYYRDLCEDKLK